MTDTAADITAALDTLNGSQHRLDHHLRQRRDRRQRRAADQRRDRDRQARQRQRHAVPPRGDRHARPTSRPALDGLNGSNIGSITISDNGAIGASVAQLTSDATAIGKLTNANATPYQLMIMDSAANVTAGLAKLETAAAAGHIASITASGGPVTVSAATALADKAALDTIVGGYAVSELLPHIVSNLTALDADAHIASIVATSGGATLTSGMSIAAPAFTLGSGTTLIVSENLAYSGALSVATGAKLSVSTGDTLTLTGTDTLHGSVIGFGTLAIAGGTTTFASGATITSSKWNVSGAGTSIVLGEALAYSGSLTAGVGTTFELSGGNLALGGAAILSGTVIGGTFALNNTKSVIERAGSVTIGDPGGAVGKIVNSAPATWNITDNSGLQPGASPSSAFVNSGLFEKTAGDRNEPDFHLVHQQRHGHGGGDHRHAVLRRPVDHLQRNVVRGRDDRRHRRVRDHQERGDRERREALAVGRGHDVGDRAKTSPIPASSARSAACSTLRRRYADPVGNERVQRQGRRRRHAGDRRGNRDGERRPVLRSPTGRFRARRRASSSTTPSPMGEPSRPAAARRSTLRPPTCALIGPTSFSGATIGSVGARTLTNSGATTVSGLTIGGTTTFANNKTLTESGGAVTLGDASGDVAKIVNASTGIWDFADDSGIGLGSSSLSSIANSGLFEKTGGTGTSVVAAAFANAHNLLVSSAARSTFRGPSAARVPTRSRALPPLNSTRQSAPARRSTSRAAAEPWISRRR